jgi:hypothetical protein
VLNGKQGRVLNLTFYSDPWSAHLFGVEAEATRELPALCMDYCGELYDACSMVPMNSSASPFGEGTDTIGQSRRSK